MSQRSVTASPEWVALQDHYKQAKEWHMRDLFEQDPKRFDKFRSACKHKCTVGTFYCGSFRVSMKAKYTLDTAKTTIQDPGGILCFSLLWLSAASCTKHLGGLI